ncbi:MAG: hypothetical protein M1816_004543 [Peltula sp. TS41687]|nr:MAG: hypothetical protein M1816_004543 [Peltula sp. TS41687]
MDIFLGKVTQQAMNYAIRSGIAITSTYAMRHCARLLASQSVKGDDYDELVALRDRLESKIRIISPAIDMIELISARGNTSLESAVALTKSLRWEIQSLGVRLAKAANVEERSSTSTKTTRTRAQSEVEIKVIKQAIRRVLEKIEDAVPLINLAITTSGVSLSTTLPSTVSPSRLLQASTFLTAGDTQYSIRPGQKVQIGPTFVLSMYMLFTAHAFRSQDHEGNMRETTWKEVVHKARVKLLRTPLEEVYDLPQNRGEEERHHNQSADDPNDDSFPAEDDIGTSPERPPIITAEAKADEFAYHLLIIEDFDDDRVHSFDEEEAQPGPCEDVELAGIREVIPIHEVSKIFYADTGKILNIGSDGEVNNPILLLKRDVNAILPRRMMDRVQQDYSGQDDDSYANQQEKDIVYEDEQSEVDAQLFGDHSSASIPADPGSPLETQDPWRIPPNLDPEWIAFEVYTEQNDDDDDDDEEAETSEAGSSEPTRPSMTSRENSIDPQLTKAMSHLHLTPTSPPAANSSETTSPGNQQPQQQLILRSPLPLQSLASSAFSGSNPIRTSLSLLEMLIRLTALQQFQQTSHLSIPDELLNFFLSEAGTTGAGGDGEERRLKRWEARRKVGFDPYDESPVKMRGENGGAGQRQAPHDQYDGSSQEEWSSGNRSPWSRRYRGSSESPSPLLVRSREVVANNNRSTPSSSRQSTPFSPPHPPPLPDRRYTTPASGPAEILKGRPKMLKDGSAGSRRQKEGSPLRRGTSAEVPEKT